ncbi:MAG: High potential iron-sulfur protein [Alphaproteobacteria bacterium]|jgi:hypothetical protein|nr:High potential iron-sulfur protein [Alphaproteobacteria bacterium]
MSDQQSILARRRFLGLALAGSAATVGAAALPRHALAQDRLDPESTMAQQLGYVEDADNVDAEAYPKYEEGQLCSNCQLYQAEPDAEWGPCTIFGNQLVAGPGWCNGYVPAAG